MIALYDGTVSNQQQQWIKQALAYCTYPLEFLDARVTFTVVSEPSCPGHKDYMCTTWAFATGGTEEAVVQIRERADDPTASFNGALNGFEEVRRFFMETVIHEIGHVVQGYFITTDDLRTTVAALFTKDGATGEGSAAGTLDDWNPLDKSWEDRIQEAVAEVFKDTYLADQYRVFENRAHWAIDATSHAALVNILLPPDLHGSDEWLPIPWDTTGSVGSEVVDGFVRGDNVIPPHWYLHWDPHNLQQFAPLIGYDKTQPFKIHLEYGGEWYHAGIDAFPGSDYLLHAEIRDDHNGIMWSHDHNVVGPEVRTVIDQDITPDHPIDEASLHAEITVEGWVPADSVSPGPDDVPGWWPERPSWFADVPGGTDPPLTGYFSYFSKALQIPRASYPYLPAAIAGMQYAHSVMRARDTLRRFPR